MDAFFIPLKIRTIDRNLTKFLNVIRYASRAVKLAVILEIFMNNTDHPPSLNGEE